MSLSIARAYQRPLATYSGGAVGSAGCGTMASDIRYLASGRAIDGGAQARVDDGVENIDHEIDGDEDQRHHQEIGRHDWNIDVLHCLHEQQSHPGPLEYGLGDDRECNN